MVAFPESVATDALIDTLWGDRPPPTARKIVQKYVSTLRERVGRDVLVTEATGYALAVDPVRIDAVRFDLLREEARSARESGQPQRAWALLGEALAMWRGRPLAGLDDVPFVSATVHRLEEARRAVEEDQLEAGLELGRHESQLPRLEQLVVQHPFRERLWAALMLAYYRSGRQAEALAAFRRLRELPAGELGLEPASELQELENRILKRDPGLSLTTSLAAAGGTNLPVPLTSFVGRTAELGQIGELLATQRLVTLLGPGGSGKSRLALEVAARHVERYPGRGQRDRPRTGDGRGRGGGGRGRAVGGRRRAGAAHNGGAGRLPLRSPRATRTCYPRPTTVRRLRPAPARRPRLAAPRTGFGGPSRGWRRRYPPRIPTVSRSSGGSPDRRGGRVPVSCSGHRWLGQPGRARQPTGEIRAPAVAVLSPFVGRASDRVG